jgi:hypothetical protein
MPAHKYKLIYDWRVCRKPRLPSLSNGNANVRMLQRRRLRRTGQNDRNAEKLRRRRKGNQSLGLVTRMEMGKRRKRKVNRARVRSPRQSDRSRSEGYLELLLWELRRRSKLNSLPLQRKPTYNLRWRLSIRKCLFTMRTNLCRLCSMISRCRGCVQLRTSGRRSSPYGAYEQLYHRTALLMVSGFPMRSYFSKTTQSSRGSKSW